jgi:hypothetical protein
MISEIKKRIYLNYQFQAQFFQIYRHFYRRQI